MLIAHIECHDFALLISHGPLGLVASHIPSLIERRGDALLLSHLTRPNPRSRTCRNLVERGREVLTILGSLEDLFKTVR